MWKDIPGWEGYYQASTLGQIRSVDRVTRGRHGPTFYRGRVLKLDRRTTKYPVAVFTREDTRTSLNVHSVITATFLGPCPQGLEACLSA
jgi:hypothetical protein